MLQASEQVSVGAFGGRDRRIPLLLSPASQSSPEKLLAGYVTSREDSKRECSVFLLESDKLWGGGREKYFLLFCWQAMLLALSVLNVSGAFCTGIGQTQTKVEKFHLLRRLKVHYVVWHQLGKSKRNFWQHSNRCFDDLPRSLKIFLVISKAAKANQVSYRRRVCTWFSTILGYKAKRELFF